MSSVYYQQQYGTQYHSEHQHVFGGVQNTKDHYIEMLNVKGETLLRLELLLITPLKITRVLTTTS